MNSHRERTGPATPYGPAGAVPNRSGPAGVHRDRVPGDVTDPGDAVADNQEDPQ